MGTEERERPRPPTTTNNKPLRRAKKDEENASALFFLLFLLDFFFFFCENVGVGVGVDVFNKANENIVNVRGILMCVSGSSQSREDPSQRYASPRQLGKRERRAFFVEHIRVLATRRRVHSGGFIRQRVFGRHGRV